MAPLVLQRKLDSLHRCIERVREKCPATAARHLDDFHAFAAVVAKSGEAGS